MAVNNCLKKKAKEDAWSRENNIDLKTFGCIKFIGYDNISINHTPKFIRFNCKNEPSVIEAVYNLITTLWMFPPPRLIISVNGGNKGMKFKTDQKKKDFKQGLIEVIKKETTWIIGGGFNFGIQKLVSEAVHEYRLYNDGNENQIKLIAISTWGVIQKNEYLIPKESPFGDDSKENRLCTYRNSNCIEKGKVPLDAHYDCFLFCDDGTEKMHDKEVDFRLKFEKCILDHENSCKAVQILYDGSKRALENAYKSLKITVPLVVIKGSGRAANVISEVMDLKNGSNLQKNISECLQSYKKPLVLNDEEIEKFKNYLFNMFSYYKMQIITHDLLNKTMKFDKKILEAIISSREDTNMEEKLNLTIRFNCHDIAEKKVFRNPTFSNLTTKILKENFKEILEKNRHEFVILFLKNNIDIEEFIDEKVIIRLYQVSLSESCRCAHLLSSIILGENKLLSLHDPDFNLDDLHDIIDKMVYKLSGSILKKTNRKNTNESYANILDMNNYASHGSQEKEDVRHIKLVNKMLDKQTQNDKITFQDIFLWSLISGYTEMAMIFWKVGKDHICSALIGSIILDKMKDLVLKRGDSDLSDKLSKASKKFQEIAVAVVMEAYEKNQLKTHTLLIRPLKKWNKMTCLQIAVRGKFLNFLNLDACQSYSKEAWMGEFSPYLSTWKNHFKRNQSDKKERGTNPAITVDNRLGSSFIQLTNSENVSFIKAMTKFCKAPIMKFIAHFVSYICFLIIFAYLNMVELKPLKNVKIVKDISAEIIVYIFMFTFIIEEARQVVFEERTGMIHKCKSYLSRSWNTFHVSIISIFLISVVLRFLLPLKYFMIARCAFSVTLSMFSLRIMQFYFISQSIGTTVIMIREMILDILFFLSTFVLFIVSYGTLVQSLQSPNSQWSLSLLRDIFYNPYFQTYGELMLDNFNTFSPCNTTSCIVQNTTIVVGFAVFLLLTNVLLINLLIAMFGNTFNRIQVESEKVFSFLQIQLVEEFHKKPPLPPPFNVVYYIIGCVFQIRKKTKKKPDGFLVKHLTKDEHIKISGFEHICMESSVLKLELFTENKPKPQSDSSSNKELELTKENDAKVSKKSITSNQEQIFNEIENDCSDFDLNMNSIINSINMRFDNIDSRFEVIEKQLEKLLKHFP